MNDGRGAAAADWREYVAFERLFNNYLSRIYTLCARLAGSRPTAVRLTADVFTEAWQNVRQLDSEVSPAAWLYRRAAEVVVRDGNGADPAGSSQLHSGASLDLSQAIDRLPTDARQVFVLHEIEGFKHEEIAEILGVTVGRSKAQLRRARVLLLEALTP